ncbi:variant erythrocyte surface antigen-1 family protein [Babesia caballi]|uniref:Variant erythrocyte surface antigen-1 family protein n=1 Tax=Babesia caballi TaxID=5871 RepID=A0AAV4LR31_BABCB|nr:variant erythrocyte surface antigen-1 family protein [Babesia caballi]
MIRLSQPPYSDCPSNLKEAIDWILRVTGKDGGQNGTQQLAGAVKELLKDVELRESELGLTCMQIKGALGEWLNKNQNGKGIKSLIESLAEGLATFIGYKTPGGNGEIGTGGIGKQGKPHESRDEAKETIYGILTYKDGYIWSYPRGADWNTHFSSADKGHAKAAMIFLSCLPMVFYGLGLLYWRCRSGGRWEKQNINYSNSPLRYFLSSQGFGKEELSGQTGEQVLATAFTKLSEFSGALEGSSSLVEYFQNLYRKLSDALKLNLSEPAETLKKHCIPVLYLCSTSYFRHQHQKQAANARPPSSIRQMLYWLSGLTITPQLGDLLKHIVTAVPRDFKVAVSGSSKKDEILKPDDLICHLITSCLSSSWVVGTIQGSGGSEKPLLHEIFSNTENLTYASTVSSLFNTLSSYTYALHFQLIFLMRQCRFTYDDACGWQKCQYGNSVTVSDTVESYLCPNSGSDCSSEGSPLQAFLTDNLKGFSRGRPGSSGHLATCSGFTCHVPMGFDGHLKGDKKTGENIYDTLAYFCGDFKDCLCQLTEKLSCLTKRTPRTLGDMFGFLWHLNGQAFSNSDVQSKLQNALQRGMRQTTKELLDVPSSPQTNSLLFQSLTTLADRVTFWDTPDSYGIASVLAIDLYGLNRHCHKVETGQYGMITVKHNSECSASGHSNTATDLWSLCQTISPMTTIIPSTDRHQDCRNAKCGGYFTPLTNSTGTTFSSVFAANYFSWILYLSDDFDAGLHELYEKLNGHKCDNCRRPPVSHASQCQCPSVVECADVLPILYVNGFYFSSASSLKNNAKNTLRRCGDFSEALKAVLANNENTPLFKFLTTIDDFLYYVRFAFFRNIAACWTIYICLILYTFVFLLDTLHVHSHLERTASHILPPLALLTSGKPIPVTKLAYLVS